MKALAVGAVTALFLMSLAATLAGFVPALVVLIPSALYLRNRYREFKSWDERNATEGIKIRTEDE